MPTAKDGVRSKVRVGYDGRVYKTFRGTGAKERYENEIRVLKTLEARGCPFVPRVLDQEDETLTLVTTNCGHPVERMSEEKLKSLFDDLEKTFGVVHDDPFLRNVTYHQQLGRFCIIDFELATILDEGGSDQLFGIRWGGVTQEGKRKGQNEDSLAVFSSDAGWAKPLELAGSASLEKEGVVFAVSDGMGGAHGGEVASSIVVSDLRRFLPGRIGDFSASAEPLALLQKAVEDLHQHVLRVSEAHPEWSGMGATLVCGLFCGRQMHFAHVGDSRIYRFSRGELKQLTFDHTRVGRLHRMGEITEMQARLHPQKHILNRVIGADQPAVSAQMGAEPLTDGDWFLFCSDGLVDGLWHKNIHQALAQAAANGTEPAEVAEGLLQATLRAGAKDDTTLFVVEVRSLPES